MLDKSTRRPEGSILMDAPDYTGMDQLCGVAADEKGWAAHINDLFPDHQPNQ